MRSEQHDLTATRANRILADVQRIEKEILMIAMGHRCASMSPTTRITFSLQQEVHRA
jgi:hypothetical protein